ncbi:unnamed protein product, partial [Ectocarpus fasciculatus]
GSCFFSVLCLLVYNLTSGKGCPRSNCQCRRASSFRPRSLLVRVIVFVILILRSCASTTSSSRRASPSAATFSNARSLATAAAVVPISPPTLFAVLSLLTFA